MPTFTPSPCRHCAHWLRRESGEDCAKGLLMRLKAGDGSVLEDTTRQPLVNFREFIEAPPLRGLGQSVADIERLLGDDPEALERLREELTATKGNPAGVNQYSGKDNNIIPSSTPDLFAEPSAKPKRQKKTQQGTRKDYTLSRLKKDAPALFEAVKDGKLSAHAAALEAGIRRPMRSIPVDTPEAALRALLRVFTVTDLAQALGRVSASGQTPNHPINNNEIPA